MEYNTKVKLVIITILAGALLICVVVCVGKAAITSSNKKPEPVTPEVVDDSAGERNAVNKVQEYILPDGRMVLAAIADELQGYRSLGIITEPKGWYAGKWGDKYNVGFEAEVGDENMKWRFFYYPSSGRVEPDNNNAEKLWR